MKYLGSVDGMCCWSASLESASLRAVLKISRSLYSKRVRVFENKTLTTVKVKNDPRSEFSNLSNWKEEA